MHRLELSQGAARCVTITKCAEILWAQGTSAHMLTATAEENLKVSLKLKCVAKQFH